MLNLTVCTVMTTLLSDIGFADGNGYERLKLVQQMQEKGEIIKTANSTYSKWDEGSGCEVWSKMNGKEIDGRLHAHFQGSARMRVALIEKMRRASEALSDGAFLCWSTPCQGENWVSGKLPFVFDAPDYDRYDGLQLPKLVEVQLTGFAFQLTGFESEEDYEEANPPDDEGYYFAARHFIPSVFTAERGENNELQGCFAEISGDVLDTAIITNPATEADFCWAKVLTIGGEVDMVCAPQFLNGYLVTGGVVCGHVLVMGRLIDERLA